MTYDPVRHLGVNDVMLACTIAWQVECPCGATAEAKGNGMDAAAELYDLGWGSTNGATPADRRQGVCPDCNLL